MIKSQDGRDSATIHELTQDKTLKEQGRVVQLGNTALEVQGIIGKFIALLISLWYKGLSWADGLRIA